MRTRRSSKIKLVATTAAMLIAGGVVLTVVPTANAVTPGQIISAVKFAYGAYTKLKGGELTLQQATDQVTNAIDSARDDILTQVGRIAAADAKACAQSAVINLADIDNMSPDSKQAFAFATADCVTKAQSYINPVEEPGAVNQIGYALNTVGPIALLARVHANFETATLQATLIDASNNLVSRLDPRCYDLHLRGDALPGAPAEVILRCEAFNGNVGETSTQMRRRGPTPPFDYSYARETAMRGTSHELTVKALPVLTL